MSRFTRRQCVQGSLAAMTVAGSTAAALPSKVPAGGGIKLSEILNPGETGRMKLAKQIGINHAIASISGVMAKVPRSQYLQVLTQMKADYAAAGLKIAGVESWPVPAEKIKLGIAGRDEEIENMIAIVEALSKAGIDMLCYNFMAGLGWYRTKVNVLERGGALTSEFDSKAAEAQGLTQWGEITEEKMWANMEYFQKAVMPVAEKWNVKMALHPDDPPRQKLRGIARIVNSAANYRRIMDIVPSPVNGVTFCQANFVAMGEDIYKLAAEWLKQRKIFFVHYRDIQGQGAYFRETFHDNGPTDMPRILKIYADGGFRGAIRPDHAPTMEGEENDRPGYAMKGKIFAIGYMKGIMDAHKIPCE
ncbi:MAG: mannonate dehydratase [Acidobacteria bacterium]|nr:mannonate dehydratase [Acidobacteriota bacterium]